MPIALLLLAFVPESPVAPGATLVKLGGGYTFAEGPARAKNGDVFFTDQPNDQILRWDGQRIAVWMQPAGRSNGLAFAPNGDLIACADGANELWAIAPDRKVTTLLKEYTGKLMNGPNDVWIRRDGAMFFTDPLYERPYWTRDKTSQQPSESVYFVAKDRKTVRSVATDLKKPNGIVGTPDGRTLYVSDIGAGVTYRYRIKPDGTLADRVPFCSLGSDGMSLDDRGNVYLTGKGVTVFERTGTQIAHIDVPENWTGNVTFGGRDRRMLFITASAGVYALKMRVRGAD